MSLLVVGSVAFDNVETPFGKVENALGGSATYFSVSASFFTQVKIVACVGRDFPRRHISFLNKRKIDTSGLEVKQGKTFRWVGRYDDLNSAQTLETHLNVFADFHPKLPVPYRNVRNIFLANIDPTLQGTVIDQMKRPSLIGADSMNYWIQNKKKELLKLLRRVDLFMTNDAEAGQLSGERNLRKASQYILSLGPKMVVIKKGEHGVILFSKDFHFYAPAFLVDKAADPTGAGDTFAGGFMGYITKCGRLNERNLRRAVVYGSVMASYAVEDFSFNRLARLKKSEIANRFKAFQKLTWF